MVTASEIPGVHRAYILSQALFCLRRAKAGTASGMRGTYPRWIPPGSSVEPSGLWPFLGNDTFTSGMLGNGYS